MSDSPLPEDLNRWPKDPYQILGVAQGIDPRELRRVYTRLIRVFKPEQFPEHFRRIREAYETVLRYAQFFQSIRGHIDDGEKTETLPTPTAVPSESSANGSNSESAGLQPWQPTASLASELEQLWDRACSGEEALVQRRLLELHHAHPSHTDVLLRLYWLQTLTPTLDPDKGASEWLVRGLAANGLGGPLWELYRREIADNPIEALSDRANRLLRLQAPAARLSEFAEWRWQAACRLNRWTVIDDDLELLYDRISMDEPEIWVRLLITAAEQLAAIPGNGPQELAHECHRQIDHFSQIHMKVAQSLDQLDFYRDVSRALEKYARTERAPFHQSLARLVAASWTRPFVELRPLLLDFLNYVARDPRLSLRELDNVQRDAAPVLAQLSNILALFRGNQEIDYSDRRPREILARVICEFLDDTTWTYYQDLRPRLLTFCLREAVTPEAVAELIDADSTTLGTQVNADWPLRCTYWGCRLFGG